ncbi:MAG: efflux RND transporter periplasmic adaptor subunit [Deltaproteobacteria bacterium]|nr:efflux RND transporter periplasmic adaptor subunit [Deltaproteobacteria bacterium]
MIKTKKKLVLLSCLILLILILTIVFAKTSCSGNTKQTTSKEIKPFYGTINVMVSTTGVVEPQNRLEIKPPIGGRIETILVNEGEFVKTGDILAFMSSTERAALLDAARLRHASELKEWQNVYKATPLLAPIDGEVIVRAVEPGQTVLANEAIIVLSDRLIIKAQVDEVDIGKIRLGQKAIVGLDAYPDIKVDSVVSHISYESKILNNVTIYEVDLLPKSITEAFKSGMSATIDVIEQSRDNILLIPIEAVAEKNNDPTVLILNKKNQKVRQKITLGIADDKNIEVLSGITANDTIVIEKNDFISLDSKKTGQNPFMPKFKKQ